MQNECVMASRQTSWLRARRALTNAISRVCATPSPYPQSQAAFGFRARQCVSLLFLEPPGSSEGKLFALCLAAEPRRSELIGGPRLDTLKGPWLRSI